MTRTTGIPGGLLALTLMALTGCGQPVSPEVRLDSLPVARAALENEWRDARRVDAGTVCVADLGPVPAGGTVRLSLLPGEAKVVASVIVDDVVAYEEDAQSPDQWADWRFELASGKGSCRVRLTSDSPFHVSTCEVVAPGDAPVNVLVYLIDTLRLDHLGCYGYEKDISPCIDAFARESVRFTHLTPQSSWTRPSVASLLTSTYPSVHGAEDRPDTLRPGLPSLAAALTAAGYETQGFMSNVNCIPVWGFGGDFTRYAGIVKEDWARIADEDVVDAVIPALRNVAGRPWFFYAHTIAPHEPYTPPEPYASQFVTPLPEDADEAAKREHTRQLYDAEIAYADAQFGRLMDAMKEQGLYDSTWIILLSDHGEEFWEHGGTSHGKTLYEEQLRVPLLVKAPRGAHAGQTCGQLVEVVDIAPTILDVLGVAPDTRFQGTSFAACLDGGEVEPRTGYASLMLESHLLRSSKTTELKHIYAPDEDRNDWYDLTGDPGETQPLADPTPECEALAVHTEQMAAQGGAGLYIMVTNGGAETRNIAGTIRSGGSFCHEARYAEALTEIVPGDGALSFRFEMPSLADTGGVPVRWQKVRDATPLLKCLDGVYEYPQDSALLRLELPLDTMVSLDLQCDGHPLDASQLFLGRLDGEHTLPTEPVSVSSLLAEPNAFDPAFLPRRFAVYVWYVAPPETVEMDDLDPQVRDALEALGYM